MSDGFNIGEAILSTVLALFSASVGFIAARAGGNDIRVVGPQPSGKAHRTPTLAGLNYEEELRARVRKDSFRDGSNSEIDLIVNAVREEHSMIVDWLEYSSSNKLCGARSATITLELTLANVGNRPGVLASVDAENTEKSYKDIKLSVSAKDLPITLRENETKILTVQLQLAAEPLIDESFYESLMRRQKLLEFLSISPMRLGISLEVVSLTRLFWGQAKYKKMNQKILFDYNEIDINSYIDSMALKSILDQIKLLESVERRVVFEHVVLRGNIPNMNEKAISNFGDESANARRIVKELIKFACLDNIQYWPTEEGFGLCGPTHVDSVYIIANNSESIYLQTSVYHYQDLSELSEFKERLTFTELAENRAAVEIGVDTIELAKDIIAHFLLMRSS